MTPESGGEESMNCTCFTQNTTHQHFCGKEQQAECGSRHSPAAKNIVKQCIHGAFPEKFGGCPLCIKNEKAESVKPCPFCGKHNNASVLDGYIDCHCLSGQYGVKELVWNNAWAHRRIAELESQAKSDWNGSIIQDHNKR